MDANSVNSMPVCVQLCELCSVLFVLTKFSYQMPYKINARQTFLCVVIYFFKKLNHSPPHPFIFCPHPPTPPPFPFPIAVQSDPPLAQSWPITPHRNQGVGWRRWQVSEGPLTRYRFDRHPSWSITRSWGVKVTGLLLLTWAGYYSRLQAPEKWLFSAAKD